MRPLPWLLAALMPLAACAPEAPAPEIPWAQAPTAQLPRWLSEAGIYSDLATLTPAPGVQTYTPAFPLWTNGSGKQRLIRLPEGATIDNRDPQRWRFPVGTVLAKTFTYEAVEGRPGVSAVETRVIARTAEGWIYGEYLWDAQGKEAQRMPDRWSDRAVDLAQKDGEIRRHTLPGQLACRACHETHVGDPVLGVDPLNVSPEMAEALPFAAPIQGQRLADLPGRTEAEREVMGYLIGNCVHCHHGQLDDVIGENAAFSLRPQDLVANTVQQPTGSSASGDGIRVVPRQPEESALYAAVVEAPQQRRPIFRPMPPMGVDTPDPRAKALLRRWIMGL